MGISDNIKHFRRRLSMTQAQLAEQLKIKPTAVSAWESGRNQPLMAHLVTMAAIFDVTVSQLIGGKVDGSDISPVYDALTPARQQNVYAYAKQQLSAQDIISRLPENHDITVHGTVSAGTGEYLETHYDVVTYRGVVPTYDFAVRVSGDSMAPLFDDGQIIFVKKTAVAHHGQIVIMTYDGNAYVKKYAPTATGVHFVSLNPSYPTITIADEQQVHILGCVIF